VETLMLFYCLVVVALGSLVLSITWAIWYWWGNSTATVKFYGSPGTLVPTGCQVQDVRGTRWCSTTSGSIGKAGFVELPARKV
jgi:hypothetical protein